MEIEERQYQITESIKKRILNGYVVDAAGCWRWRGWKHRQGYGLLTINNKRYLAHRVSYHIAHGAIPDGVHICHHCDVTDCINPDHLYAGSAKTNRADCIERGRDNTAMLHKVGSQKPQAKLTEAGVLEIRQSTKAPRILAKQYGVTRRTIYKVRAKKSWCHV